MALVAFLRGVNVGGHKTFRPSLLAKQLARYDVVNIGAAGTFVVRGRISRATLRAELAKKLPFSATLMLCAGRELLALDAADPYRKAPKGRGLVRFVSVMAKRPHRALATPLDLPAKGKWLVRVFATRGPFVFGVYRRQMETIGHLGKLDGLMGVPVTTRNWNTIAAVIEVLRDTG
jgi:uncharacterized protein (DUF1697 family)